MADRIGVMDQGRLLQVASPHELYEAPNCRMVADFIGKMNLFCGRVVDAGAAALVVESELGELRFERAGPSLPAGGRPRSASRCVRRRSACRTSDRPWWRRAGRSRVRGRVVQLAYLGDASLVYVETETGRRITCRRPNERRAAGRAGRGRRDLLGRLGAGRLPAADLVRYDPPSSQSHGLASQVSHDVPSSQPRGQTSRVLRITTWNVNSIRLRLDGLAPAGARGRPGRALPAGDQGPQRAVPGARAAGARLRAPAAARPARLSRRRDPLEDAARGAALPRLVRQDRLPPRRRHAAGRHRAAQPLRAGRRRPAGSRAQPEVRPQARLPRRADRLVPRRVRRPGAAPCWSAI